MPKLNDNLTVTNIITEDGCKTFVLSGDDGANYKMVMQDDVALMVDHSQEEDDFFPPPLPVGAVVRDGLVIVGVNSFDLDDDYQPYQYRLSDGDLYWIPISDYEACLKQLQPSPQPGV